MARASPRKRQEAAGGLAGGLSPVERFRCLLPRLDASLALVRARGEGWREEAVRLSRLYEDAAPGWAQGLLERSCPPDGPESDAMAAAWSALLEMAGASPGKGGSMPDSKGEVRSLMVFRKEGEADVRLVWLAADRQEASAIGAELRAALGRVGYLAEEWKAETVRGEEAGGPFRSIIRP